MPRNELGVAFDINTGFSHQHAHCRQRYRDQGGLCIFRERQLLDGSFPHGRGQLVAKNVVDLTIDTDGPAGDATALLTATDGHPFWVPTLQEWRTAGELVAGDDLRTADGATVTVAAVRARTEITRAYNLTVAEQHTYYVFAGDVPILVHNEGDDDPPKPRKYVRSRYGRTPTAADRAAIGAGPGQVADHDPPLVKRWWEGDPSTGEKPGIEMTDEELKASGSDRSRMQVQPQSESNSQGGKMAAYSRQQNQDHDLC